MMDASRCECDHSDPRLCAGACHCADGGERGHIYVCTGWCDCEWCHMEGGEA